MTDEVLHHVDDIYGAEKVLIVASAEHVEVLTGHGMLTSYHHPPWAIATSCCTFFFFFLKKLYALLETACA